LAIFTPQIFDEKLPMFDARKSAFIEILASDRDISEILQLLSQEFLKIVSARAFRSLANND